METVYQIVATNETELQDTHVGLYHNQPTINNLRIVNELYEADLYSVIKRDFYKGKEPSEVAIMEVRKEYLQQDFDFSTYIEMQSLEDVKRDGNTLSAFVIIGDYSIVFDAIVCDFSVSDDSLNISIEIVNTSIVDESSDKLDYNFNPKVLMSLGQLVRDHLKENADNYLEIFN